MKKILILTAIVSLLLCAFSSCGKKSEGEVMSISADITEISKAKKVTYINQKTKKDIVKTFLDNEDKWLQFDDVIEEPYILFFDIDFDGEEELCTSVIQGTGSYSYNRYFKVKNGNVVEIFTDTPEGDSDFDIVLGDKYGCPNIVKRKSDGKKFYYCYDCIKNGYSETYESFGLMNVENGKIHSDKIFNITTIYEENEDNPSITYAVRNTECSKGSFDKTQKKFGEEYEIMNMSYSSITVSEYKALDSQKKYDALLKVYDSFNYGE